MKKKVRPVRGVANTFVEHGRHTYAGRDGNAGREWHATGEAGGKFGNTSPGNTSPGNRDLATPDQLVGLGFRGWVTGLRQGDLTGWQQVWTLYSNALGTRPAEVVVSSLASWAKAVCAASRQEITVQPLGACGFCRDECLAVSMIAACQHNTCPAMRACAFALMSSAHVDEVLHHAGAFAITLRSLDRIVSPGWIVNADAIIAAQSRLVH